MRTQKGIKSSINIAKWNYPEVHNKLRFVTEPGITARMAAD